MDRKINRINIRNVRKTAAFSTVLYSLKENKKDIFSISAVGAELSYSQKVGSDSEPLRGRLQPSR